MTTKPQRRRCRESDCINPELSSAEKVEKGRSQDLAGLEADIWAMTDGDRAGGSDGADRGLIKLSNIAGAGEPGYIAVMSFRGGARVPKDWGDAGVTKDRGKGKWKMECSVAKEMESERGGAGGTREPGRAARQRVSGRAEGGRSQNGAERSMGRDGMKGIRGWRRSRRILLHRRCWW